MKKWEKILYAVSVIAFAISASIFFFQPKRKCPLCDSFRYHAPCLIDLDTGALIELDIYFPHETKAAELADPQPEMSTFSFIHIGTIVGSKLTENKVIEFDVPVDDKYTALALCKKCQYMLPPEYTGRYVLADLYDTENKTLFPIEKGGALSLRCYDISMIDTMEENAISVTVQGTLDINN